MLSVPCKMKLRSNPEVKLKKQLVIFAAPPLYQFMSCEGVKHCSVINPSQNQNIPLNAPRIVLCDACDLDLRRVHFPLTRSCSCGFENSSWSMALNHSQLPQSAFCQVSHPLLISNQRSHGLPALRVQVGLQVQAISKSTSSIIPKYVFTSLGNQYQQCPGLIKAQ